MDPAELKAFEAEVGAQTREIERVFQRIEARARSKADFAAEGLAFQIHNLYSAFEELFRIVANRFENHLAGESGYHLELLRRMNASVAGIRPGLVPDELLGAFDSLRAFRHFFRHAYAQDIDPRKIEPVLADAELLHRQYPAMISAFLEQLR